MYGDTNLQAVLFIPYHIIFHHTIMQFFDTFDSSLHVRQQAIMITLSLNMCSVMVCPEALIGLIVLKSKRLKQKADSNFGSESE